MMRRSFKKSDVWVYFCFYQGPGRQLIDDGYFSEVCAELIKQSESTLSPLADYCLNQTQ